MEYNLASELRGLDAEILRKIADIDEKERVLFRLLNRKIDILIEEINWLEELIMEDIKGREEDGRGRRED